MAGQNPGELDAGKFPKEPDEGDEEVIERNLAQQQAKQGQKAGSQGASRGGSGDQSSDAAQGASGSGGTEGSLSEDQKSATIDSTKGLP